MVTPINIHMLSRLHIVPREYKYKSHGKKYPFKLVFNGIVAHGCIDSKEGGAEVDEKMPFFAA